MKNTKKTAKYNGTRKLVLPPPGAPPSPLGRKLMRLRKKIEESGVKLLTAAPHAVQAEEVPAAGGSSVEEFSPALQDKDFRVKVARREERAAGKVSLSEARVVVGGGRGVGSPEGFRPLEELAELLGGVVGCSRVVTSLGWRPHTDQVGQTGVRIAPDLYVACGISGAIQHMVGAKGAKKILVINTDPQAPILAHADYAIIGDVQEVVPALVSAIRDEATETSRPAE